MLKEPTTKGTLTKGPSPDHQTYNYQANDPKLCATAERRPRPKLHNRVHVVMIHASRYSFQGRARLAADVGVSRSTISRLINGQTSPSHALVQSITDTLSTHLGRPLLPRDLFSPDGRYPERSGCLLSGCRGCFPEAAFDGNGRRRVEWLNARPGDWSLAPETL